MKCAGSSRGVVRFVSVKAVSERRRIASEVDRRMAARLGRRDAPCRPRWWRARDDRLYVGHDGPAQRRDALAPQHPDQRLRVPLRRHVGVPHRRVPVLSAAVSYLRAHVRLLPHDDGGATTAYARSIAQLGEDLQAIRPTVLVSVPRIYERVWGAIRARSSTKVRRSARSFSCSPWTWATRASSTRKAAAAGKPLFCSGRCSTSSLPARCSRVSAGACAPRFRAVRRCRRRSRASSSGWACRCCRATA